MTIVILHPGKPLGFLGLTVSRLPRHQIDKLWQLCVRLFPGCLEAAERARDCPIFSRERFQCNHSANRLWSMRAGTARQSGANKIFRSFLSGRRPVSGGAHDSATGRSAGVRAVRIVSLPGLGSTILRGTLSGPMLSVVPLRVPERLERCSLGSFEAQYGLTIRNLREDQSPDMAATGQAGSEEAAFVSQITPS